MRHDPEEQEKLRIQKRNEQSNHSQKQEPRYQQLDLNFKYSGMETPRISDYDSNKGSEMKSFLKDMVTQMRTEYIETSDDEVVEENAEEDEEYGQEQEYDQEQEQEYD